MTQHTGCHLPNIPKPLHSKQCHAVPCYAKCFLCYKNSHPSQASNMHMKCVRVTMIDYMSTLHPPPQTGKSILVQALIPC